MPIPKHIPLFSVLLLSSFTSLSALASLDSSTQTPSPLGQIDELVSVVPGLKAVQSADKLLFMSDNGRFVIDGTIYDVWSKKALHTIDSIRVAAERIDLQQLDLNLKELSPIVYGQGSRDVVVFVDPNCAYCHQLLNEASRYTEQYQFHLLPIPVLGTQSERDVRKLSCTKNNDQALKALLDRTIELLPDNPDCDLAPIQRTLLTAQLLGVQGVPFLIASDGRTHRGKPNQLGLWLEGLE